MADTAAQIRHGGPSGRWRDAARVEQIVRHLRRGEAAIRQNAADRRRITEAGDAVEAALALVLQPPEHRDRLVQDLVRGEGWRRAIQGDRIVQLIDVDAVPAEPRQAAFERCGHGSRDVAALLRIDAHLGADRDIGPQRLQRATEIHLRHAIAIGIGSVEIGDAVVDRTADGAVLLGRGPLDHQAADRAATVAQHRDGDPRASELPLSHARCLPVSRRMLRHARRADKPAGCRGGGRCKAPASDEDADGEDIRMPTRRALLHGTATALAAAMLAQPAFAAYPERPIRVIVPFTAGGNTDILARILVTRMAERIGRPMVIENRAGAGGSVGAEAVARAAPDGYTLLFGAGGPLTANPVLQANLPYDVERDFRPIGLVGILPMICQVGPRIPARSLTEFIAILRERPNQVTIATPGAGSAAHLALELLMAGVNVRAVHVPYRGGSAMVADLLSGAVDAGMVELPSALPLHLDGKAPIIAIATADRSPVLPQVQTFIEAGLPGFTAGSYGGLLARRRRLPTSSRRCTAHWSRRWPNSRAGAHRRSRRDPRQRGAASPDGFAAFLRGELVNARRAADLAGLRPS